MMSNGFFKCSVYNKENVILLSELFSYITRFSQCNSPWPQALLYIQSCCTQGSCQQWTSRNIVIIAILLLEDVMIFILEVIRNALLARQVMRLYTYFGSLFHPCLKIKASFPSNSRHFYVHSFVYNISFVKQVNSIQPTVAIAEVECRFSQELHHLF